jgi:protein TonB
MHRALILPRLAAFAASIGLHILFLAGVVYLARHAPVPLAVTPVNIVDLPRDVLRQLPPVAPPPVAHPAVPPQGRPLPEPPSERRSVPAPSRFGSAPDVSLPRTHGGRGTPEGSDKGTADAGRSPIGAGEAGKGPLPFLTQADIDALARKGMPEKKAGDESVTLDTNEFKFISYNRWLKIKVESVLKYPELAALSGIQGTLYIKFDILKDGSLGGLELLKSSGYKILDDEALRAIRASAPFSPLPDDWRMDRYPIRAAVLFYLNEAYIR